MWRGPMPVLASCVAVLHSVLAVLLVLLIEFFVYFLLAVYFDHVFKDENGAPGESGRGGGNYADPARQECIVAQVTHPSLSKCQPVTLALF